MATLVDDGFYTFDGSTAAGWSVIYGLLKTSFFVQNGILAVNLHWNQLRAFSVITATQVIFPTIPIQNKSKNLDNSSVFPRV